MRNSIARRRENFMSSVLNTQRIRPMHAKMEAAVALTRRAMQRTTEFGHYLVLLRQFQGINKVIAGLSQDERRKIALVALSEMTQANAAIAAGKPVAVVDWAEETSAASERAKSPHVQVQAGAVRRWLVAAYRLTKQSSYGEVQSLHRAVLRSLRLMQGANANSKASDTHWVESL
jgi:hypothetical protein